MNKQTREERGGMERRSGEREGNKKKKKKKEREKGYTIDCRII